VIVLQIQINNFSLCGADAKGQASVFICMTTQGDALVRFSKYRTRGAIANTQLTEKLNQENDKNGTLADW
jgi:hypothetical protein